MILILYNNDVCIVNVIKKNHDNYCIITVKLFGITIFKFANKAKCIQSITNNLVVSLTSYPARINTIDKVIKSIFNQSYTPKQIILWLALDEFPNKEKDLPNQLIKLVDKGLTINWCDNIGPYKKLIPTLEHFSSSYIITLDDDVIYNKNTIKNLVDTYIEHHKCIITNKAHYISFNEHGHINKYANWKFESNYKKESYSLFLTGVTGVLYPPNCFYKDILDKNLFTKLSYNTDDIWFWAMAVLNNTKIKLSNKKYKKIKYIDGTQNKGLFKVNISTGNDANITKILNYYPQIINKLDKNNLELS